MAAKDKSSQIPVEKREKLKAAAQRLNEIQKKLEPYKNKSHTLSISTTGKWITGSLKKGIEE